MTRAPSETRRTAAGSDFFGLVRGTSRAGGRALGRRRGPGADRLRSLGRRRDTGAGALHGGIDPPAEGSGRISTSSCQFPAGVFRE